MSILLPGEKVLSYSLSQVIGRVIEQGLANKTDIDLEKLPKIFAVVELASSLMSVVDEIFGRYGLTQPRFIILVYLYSFSVDSLTPAQLAETLGVKRATMTGLLDGLEKGDWIVRKPHGDDRRKVIVSLSEAGRARLEELLPAHVNTVIALAAGLSKEEIVTLLELFEKFVGHAKTVELKDWAPTANEKPEKNGRA